MAEMTFRAQKMIDRCRAEGKDDLLTKEMIAKIKSMDGMTGTDYNWQSQVMGEPLVWLQEAQTYVNIIDCE